MITKTNVKKERTKMSTAELCALGITAILIAMDYLSGIAAAASRRDLQSSKMREGLWHKLGEVGAILLAYLVAEEGHYIGLPYQIDLLIPAVLIWISVMEITSILENLAILNPDLASAGFLQIFKKTTEGNDHHENVEEE
jgi:hypothetical protein